MIDLIVAFLLQGLLLIICFDVLVIVIKTLVGIFTDG